MSASGRQVNYNVRTAKSVERHMIVDTVKELFKGYSVDQKRYIGFGSFYFTDFKLMHKALHIDNMVSIEKFTSDTQRVNFNKPYKCIDVRFGESQNLLPKLKWKKGYKDFIWMDYDKGLQTNMFLDCEIIFKNAAAGSVYLMTCNKQLKDYDLDAFKMKFDGLVPVGTVEKNLSSINSAKLIRLMFLSKIEEVIMQRNYKLSDDEKLKFVPLLFFTYSDSVAEMMSFGGVLIRNDFDANKLQTDLSYLPFVRFDDNEYEISPPNLTYKEIHHFNGHLPNNEEDLMDLEELVFIPKEEKLNYLKLYRYMPTYMDVVN